MLKAGALIYAIFISFLIALTSSSVIFISYSNRVQMDRSFESDRLLNNAESGIQLLLSRQILVATDIPKTVDLYGRGIDSVRLEKRAWGLFDIGISKSFSKRMSQEIVALIGSSANKKDSLAIYLLDMDKPLSVCGDTKIRGNCFLPKAGIQRAYIEGKNFTGNKFVEGRTLKSEKTLPVLDKELIKRIQNIAEGTFHLSDSIQDISFLSNRDSSVRSFTKPTIYFTTKAPLILDNKILQGNIVIVSSKSVTIKATTQIGGIQIYAPKIIIEDGFSGNLQAFAGDSLVVGKKCKLTYPSVLALYRNKNSKDEIRLTLSEDVTCQGILFAGQDVSDIKKHVLINISKNDNIYGQVYCTGAVDLKGSIYGSVFCSSFILKTSSSVYENHLLDATIDITRLPEEYGGIVLMQEKAIEHKCIVKWLE